MSAQPDPLYRAVPLALPAWCSAYLRWQASGKKVRLFASTLIALCLIGRVGISIAADPILVGVASVPHSLAFFVAEHEGYFAQDAPNIKLIDCFPGRKCLEQMLAGTVQLATAADTPIVHASFTRADFAVVATFATSTTDIHIVASKAAGIFSTKELVGKKVGVIKGSSIDYFLDSVLVFEGLDPTGIEKVDIAPEAMANALRQKKIDAFALFDPGLSQAVESLGDSVTVLRTPPIYLSTFNLVAPRAFLRKNDADIVKVLRVIDKANLFIRQQPDAARRILLKRLNMVESTNSLIKRKLDYTLSLDQTLVKTLEGEARWFSQQKGFTGVKPTNYLDFIYMPPLRQVRPQAVTIVK